jgi:hypothetical protein
MPRTKGSLNRQTLLVLLASAGIDAVNTVPLADANYRDLLAAVQQLPPPPPRKRLRQRRPAETSGPRDVAAIGGGPIL